MTTSLEWYDVALRLALTLVGGAILGVDRSEHSRPAGLRTVLLVCLAASLAMVLANLMIATRGKAADSFVQLDMMRLPLGILTGVGFIGGGAIIRRDDIVLGVTTAATLWFASVVGLCFGAGQLWLGTVGVAIGFFALTALRRLEDRLPQDHRAILTLIVDAAAALDEQEIRRRFNAAGYTLGPPNDRLCRSWAAPRIPLGCGVDKPSRRRTSLAGVSRRGRSAAWRDRAGLAAGIARQTASDHTVTTRPSPIGEGRPPKLTCRRWPVRSGPSA